MKLLFLFIALAMATEHWVFHLEKDVDPETFAIEHNLRHIKRIFNFDVFEASPKTFKSLQMNAAAMEKVIFSEKQVAKKQYHRGFNIGRSTDPLYSSQWHLHPPYEYSVKVNEVVEDGRGIVIGIVDDGLQYTHPDIKPNYNAGLSYDFNGHRASPMPSAQDGHGTSAAGVAAAAQNNGHCGRGVAPKASIAGIRLIAGPAYDYVEAEALTFKNDEIDIYSCSWGPYDGGHDLAGPGAVTLQALAHGARLGRHGKGSIFVWAAGNGAHNKDNINYDGYANSIYTIAIGAIDAAGEKAYYSETGSPLMAVVPSSGAGKGIVTTDLLGHDGYSSGECTSDFGGTSSACPLAAGLMALILQKRPELTWRDVQHIVVKAGEKIHPHDPDWTNSPHPHSHKYGFGLLRAPTLISETRKHTLVPAQKFVISPIVRSTSATAPLNGFWKNAELPISGGLNFVEHVQVIVNAQHRIRGNVIIELVSPHGTVSRLTEQHSDHHSGAFQWMYTSVRHWGEKHTANQKWTVRFKDAFPGGRAQGQWNSVQVVLSGF